MKMEQTLNRTNMIGMLEEAIIEAKEDGWKGNGSKAISQEVYQCAQRFLKSLPIDIPNPEIAAEPDGEIEFEWYRDKYHLISISVGLNQLNFAGYYGEKNRYCNREEFLDELIPQTILEKIYELFPKRKFAKK